MNRYLDTIYEILRVLSIISLAFIAALGISTICFFLPMISEVYYNVVNSAFQRHTSIILFAASAILFITFGYLFSLISLIANGLADAIDNSEIEENL
jgi:thiol:disulfide interchange protein